MNPYARIAFPVALGMLERAGFDTFQASLVYVQHTKQTKLEVVASKGRADIYTSIVMPEVAKEDKPKLSQLRRDIENLIVSIHKEFKSEND